MSQIIIGILIIAFGIGSIIQGILSEARDYSDKKMAWVYKYANSNNDNLEKIVKILGKQ